MIKNLMVLFLTVLLAAISMTASGSVQEAMTPGQTVSLSAVDQELQDGVQYEYFWTVVEVDDAGNEIGEDLVTTGVLTQTGSNAEAFAFPAPVIPEGQQKKFKIKAKLTPKKGQNGAGLTTCIGETSQEIVVNGPTESVIGEDLIVCEDDSNVEVELDESIGDNGLDFMWSVDDEAPGYRNHPGKGKRYAKIDVTGLSLGEHVIKLKIKNHSGKGYETEITKKIYVIHKPEPRIE